MNINQFLDKLQKVKSLGNGKWQSCCPVHDDKNPSLAIRLIEGDRLLFHCFGCGANGIEICESLGIDPGELFQSKKENHKRESRPFSADQILNCLAYEGGIIEMAASDIVNGKSLSVSDFKRVELARARIKVAIDYASR